MPDIVIIGGGIVGSSTAYHLAMAGRAGDIVVIEPDPTYEFAAAPLSTGGVRILFSLPENILMSQYGHEVFGNFHELMAVDGEAAHIDFKKQGYLHLALSRENAAVLESNWHIQTELDCNVVLLDAAALKSRYPPVNLDGVVLGALAPDDGWMDPYAAVIGFRRKARSLGVTYLKERVVDVEFNRTQIQRVVLESGEKVAGEVFLNLTGAWAPGICEMVGMKVPVDPMRRQNYYYECRSELGTLALTKPTSGASFRPEGAGYLSGYTNLDEPSGFNFEVDYDNFETFIWPSLAERVPAFETVKLVRAWSGHYAQNRFDGQTIIGTWPGGPENFYLATGFSGAGLQKAPAIGRAFKELLIDGGYQTIDLGRLGYQRILDDKPMPEAGIVA